MFSLCFLVVLVLLPYQGFGQQCSVCPEGFTYYNQWEKCYKASSTKLSWDEASRNCVQLGSHLVTITSDDNMNPLNEVIAPIKVACMNTAVNRAAFWTSGRRKCPNGPFTWVPNVGIKLAMSYTHWLDSEPNNSGGIEDCIHFLAGDSNLVWNDTPCGMGNCFVCEYDL